MKKLAKDYSDLLDVDSRLLSNQNLKELMQLRFAKTVKNVQKFAQLALSKSFRGQTLLLKKMVFDHEEN